MRASVFATFLSHLRALRGSHSVRHLLPGVVAGAAGIGLSLLAWTTTSSWETELAQLEFKARAQSHHLALQNGINVYLSKVDSLRAFFDASQDVSRSEFQIFADSILRDQDAILAVSWIPRVTHAERADHEGAAQRESLVGYRINSAGSDGTLKPAPDRAEYYPILYSSRERPGSPVYGLNLADGGVRQKALEHARDTNHIAISSTFLLRSSEASRIGFFVSLPVFRPGQPQDTVEDRRTNLVGFVQGVFQTGAMIETILASTAARGGLDLYFYRSDAAPDQAPLYFHPSRSREAPTAVLSRSEVTAGLHWAGDLKVGDRQWHYVAAPTPTGPGHPSHVGSWLVLASGLLISGCIAAFLWTSSLHARRLQLSNARLDQTLGALNAANEQLQLQNERFEAALSNMAQGLVMFDGDRRLLVVNQPFASLFAVPRENFQIGMTPEEFVEIIVRERNLPPERAASLHAQQKYMIEKGKQHNYAFDTSDGRRMSVMHTPMSNGGWVTTYLDATARHRAEAKIAHMAHHDALTELPNRLRFREQLQHELGRLRDGASIAVLCLDLDLFKGVNDTLGHPAGDQLLRIVSRRLNDAVRDSDMVARLGGDEFAIIQTQTVQQPDEATALAGRLIDVISAPYDIEGHQVVVGMSVGIAIAPLDGRDADQLIKNADMALYRAKEEGRGTYRFFERAMDARARTRRELELDLRSALHTGEFVLNYQPIVDVQSGEITTFEALVRWHHPRRGLISPADFIPLAETTGLIVPLGEWVLRKACSDAAGWSRPVRVAVNLSPAQFRHRTLVQSVVSAVATSGLAPDRLELEITESVLLQDSEATLATLHTLRDFGVHISMDDFGTGYSSLSYLRSFPFDKIKIDQSFVRDLATRDDCVAIIRAVTGLGNSLGIATTAEGVETTEQLELLRQYGCGEVQGFLFSRPRPAADVEAMLRQGATARSAA
jgi:diguanylate cyclase (GGDEF)-like protein